ncbi:MAG: hypothetical protein Ct9H90mP21_1930 [Methanobacteriota archaeon]|nr:MAG: hypothetical protein Ct9H90mP21_1930 [Euryarchaeota archaeon]
MGSTVYHLSSRLADMGHKISVITRKSRGEPPQLDNVEIIEVSMVEGPIGIHKVLWEIRSQSSDPPPFRASSRCGPSPLPHGILE